MLLNPVGLYRKIRRDRRDKRALGDKEKLPEEVLQLRSTMTSDIRKNIALLSAEVLVAICAAVASTYIALSTNPEKVDTMIGDEVINAFLKTGVTEKSYTNIIDKGIHSHEDILTNVAVAKMIYEMNIKKFREAVETLRFKNNEKARELLAFLDKHGQMQLYTPSKRENPTAELRWKFGKINIPVNPQDVTLAIAGDGYDRLEGSNEIYSWVSSTTAPHYDAQVSTIFFSDGNSKLSDGQALLNLLVAASDARSHKEKGKVDHTDKTWLEALWCDDASQDKEGLHRAGCAVYINAKAFLILAMTYSIENGTEINFTPPVLFRIFDDLFTRVEEGSNAETKASLTFLMVRFLLAYESPGNSENDIAVNAFIKQIQEPLRVLADDPSSISKHFITE